MKIEKLERGFRFGPKVGDKDILWNGLMVEFMVDDEGNRGWIDADGEWFEETAIEREFSTED